jgi:hypothetical protein
LRLKISFDADFERKFNVPHPLLSVYKNVLHWRMNIDFVGSIVENVFECGGKLALPSLMAQLPLAEVAARNLSSLFSKMLPLIPLDDPHDLINSVDSQKGGTALEWTLRNFDRWNLCDLLKRFPTLHISKQHLDIVIEQEKNDYSHCGKIFRMFIETAVKPYLAAQKEITQLTLFNVANSEGRWFPTELYNIIFHFLSIE